MIAPTLHTPRLTLRALTIADYPVYAAFMASSRSVHIGGPYDSSAAWGNFCHDAGSWALFGQGALMIDLSATGDTLGCVGINRGPLFPEPELGWLLYDGFEGQGYATEAALALRDWGFASAGLATLVSYIDPPNTAFARVAMRIGAALDPAAPRPPGSETDLVFRHRSPQ